MRWFAFRAAVLVLLREIFKSLHGKIACALVVLLRDKFHDSRPSEHQDDIQEDDPLVHFRREAEKGLDQAHWSGDLIYVRAVFHLGQGRAFE